MLANILIVTVTILAVGLLLIWLQTRKQNNERLARFELGEPATATIIEVGTSIMGNYGEPFSAALRFMVTSRSGQPYKVRSPWVVEFDHIGDIRDGASFPVRIDKNKRTVIHPDVAWAKYDWQREHEPEPVYEDTHPVATR